MGQSKKLHLFLVTPRDSVDCNQLASMLFNTRLKCSERQPQYSVGAPCLFWMHLVEYTTEVCEGVASFARKRDAVDVSVNELARQLELWA